MVTAEKIRIIKIFVYLNATEKYKISYSKKSIVSSTIIVLI